MGFYWNIKIELQFSQQLRAASHFRLHLGDCVCILRVSLLLTTGQMHRITTIMSVCCLVDVFPVHPSPRTGSVELDQVFRDELGVHCCCGRGASGFALPLCIAQVLGIVSQEEAGVSCQISCPLVCSPHQLNLLPLLLSQLQGPVDQGHFLAPCLSV